MAGGPRARALYISGVVAGTANVPGGSGFLDDVASPNADPGIVHDLSGRRQLERQIVDAGTQEQRRIGQDLHDGLCQDLIGIAFQADFAARRLAARSLPEAETIDKVAADIRQAAGQARRLSHGLNPVDLQAGGLPFALGALAAKISESFSVSCTFHDGEAPPVRDNATATHLYRIAQEAVSNAIKHGKARHIRIRVIAGDGKLTLTVKDDGVGLSVSRALRVSAAPPTGAANVPASEPGIGLHTMHYRANMIGGCFAIRSGRRGGTVVTCSIRVELPQTGAQRRRHGAPVTARSDKSSSANRVRSR